MGGNTYGSVSGRVLENDALTGAANVKLQIRATVFGGIGPEGARTLWTDTPKDRRSDL